MNDVLIIAEPSELVAAVDRSLIALGFQPRRAAPAEMFDGVSPGRFSMIVLVDEVARISERLAADDHLATLPVLVVADDQMLATGAYAAVGNELLVHPFSAGEFQTRVARARFTTAKSEGDEVLVSGSLEINKATYQVKVDGAPVNFTYMEYELLKFFVTHPDRVFSREALLSNVWGYDYYGGARTVDVHIRRLRSKLGPDHAERIRTLRSVGYRWEGRTG